MTPVNFLKVGICHSEAIVNAGLAALLADYQGIEVRTDAAAGGWADVVVTDYADAIERLQRCAAGAPRILIVSQRRREWDVRTALAAGVHGYVPQQCQVSELMTALHKLGAGERYFNQDLLACAAHHRFLEGFTLRESAVLKLLAQGCSNKQIARDLDIGVGTVKTHVKSLFNKLGASARTEAVVLATRRGIVSA